MKLTATIDSTGLDELAALGLKLAYGPKRPPVEASGFKVVGGDAGKVKCKSFTVTHRLSPVRGWEVWAKPLKCSPHDLGLQFGVGRIGIKGKFFDWITDLLPTIPRIKFAKGRLLVNLHPWRVRATCTDDLLTVEVER